MTLSRRRFLTIAASWSGAALTGHAAQARSEWRGLALGADAHLVLDGPDDATRAVLHDLRELLIHVEAQFSLYDPLSALSRLNRTGELHDPHPDFTQIMALADQVHRVTQGRYDPTVQPLWRALAEGRDPAAARALIGWDRVRITPDRITLAPGQALTLNGLAQGFATDLATALLDHHGLRRGLVNLGEFAARGGPWRVGIADPQYGLMLSRSLTGSAIATSSPGALSLGRQGHILDPRGHLPVWSTISVEAASAAMADGLSTAGCLMSAADLRRLMSDAATETGVTRLTAIDAQGDLRTF